MATSVQEVFGAVFPPEVRAVLAAFELFSLNFFELGLPLECMGLVSFFNRLLFTLLAPLGLLACAPPLAWCMLRLGGGERSPRAVLLAALPVALVATHPVPNRNRKHTHLRT